MKLIIEIPDEVYNFTVQRGHLPYGVSIAGNIIDGKVVPKEYGDLIDEHGDLIDRNIVIPADMRGKENDSKRA